MNRIVASIVLTLILLGGYFLLAFSVRRSFLFGPGPFTFGKLASQYVRTTTNADDSKVLAVFLSVSFVSTALPIFLLLSILRVPRQPRLP
jgi:hypothetical protein